MKGAFMEFRAPTVAMQKNAKAILYLTKNLTDPAAGQQLVNGLLDELGNVVDTYPDWHPILTAPWQVSKSRKPHFSRSGIYSGANHIVTFVKGFVTCPYSDETAGELLGAVNKVPGLYAYRLQGSIYADNAYPVVVVADEVKLEADGTIRSRDALAWFAQESVKEARKAEIAETWWNIRSRILGTPHGSRSSLFVNQHTGVHMQKILDALNNSGMYGPIKEFSLDMLSKKKRETISKNLIRTALKSWDRQSEKFEFELRGEVCKASVRDTWNDGMELSIQVKIGDDDLRTSGFYYAERDHISDCEILGKRALAEKFI
jgi:hypothetical protein